MSRPLIIPQKRRLLDHNGKELKQGQKPIPKVINPSAVPAETRIQKSLRHLIPENADADAYNEAIAYDSKPEPIEWHLGDLPQPFLDPDLWEAMLKHAREKLQQRFNETNAVNGGSGPVESADQQRRREEREVEYGSMAIRGRASLRGRAPALGSGMRTRRSGG